MTRARGNCITPSMSLVPMRPQPIWATWMRLPGVGPANSERGNNVGRTIRPAPPATEAFKKLRRVWFFMEWIGLRAERKLFRQHAELDVPERNRAAVFLEQDVAVGPFAEAGNGFVF